MLKDEQAQKEQLKYLSNNWGMIVEQMEIE